ncbi:MAG: TIGR03087 family PEP-CTERM/XrtA system glycosyltransferase [Gammaproteobacteria bacterium]|nr:TIGR03087 family PEP-CTERM/XrtA system glycosyltransferase [Gammaproteobacteria bacterium]MCP5135672.1 TIGR03087 family PEP-CTERM/XrtA system glycosyltransferase [Gammaproteobacteria bacterium]
MKVLYVTHRMPFPPSDGARVRAFHCIDHLHRQGHEVTVAVPARNQAEMDAVPGLLAHCDRVLIDQVNAPMQSLRMVACLAGMRPSSMGYFHSRALARQIREAVQTHGFDLICVHSSSVATYVEDIADVPKLLDFVDMDSQKWLDYAGFKSFPLSLGYWLEGIKLERAERRLANRFDLNAVVTPGELASLEAIAPGSDNHWYPNGVNVEACVPAPGEAEAHSLVFVGRMDYFPNQDAVVWFCDAVMPGLRARYPDVRLYIVGADPTPVVRALGDQAGITVTGTVPEVHSWVRRATVSIAPLKLARGMQNKILEAMALQVPVVASPKPAQGVDAVVGEHLLAADSAEDWIETLSRLFDDPKERARLALAGRQRVLEKHRWDTIMQDRFEPLIARCIENFRAGKP